MQNIKSFFNQLMCAKLQLSAKYLIKTHAKLDKKRKF